MLAIPAIAMTGAIPAQAPSASGARVPAPEATEAWRVRRSAAVDVWYHGLATIGAGAPGALPYYRVGYAGLTEARKRTVGVFPTRLDREASRLRLALAQDSTVEVIHFLPLYFPSATPDELLAALRATLGSDPGRPGPENTTAVAAIGRALPGPAQRQLLGRVADAIADEWRTYYAAELRRTSHSDAARIAVLQRRWNARFLPAIAPYLRSIGIHGGELLISPALGPEGRILRGHDGTATVAVQLGADDEPDAPLYSAVRELCFPFVEEITATVPSFEQLGRVAAAAESGRAAVRCGAMLLDSEAPSLAAGYRATFYGTRPAPGQFEARFHLQPAVLRALTAAIARVTRTSARSR